LLAGSCAATRRMQQTRKTNASAARSENLLAFLMVKGHGSSSRSALMGALRSVTNVSSPCSQKRKIRFDLRGIPYHTNVKTRQKARSQSIGESGAPRAILAGWGMSRTSLSERVSPERTPVSARTARMPSESSPAMVPFSCCVSCPALTRAFPSIRVCRFWLVQDTHS